MAVVVTATPKRVLYGSQQAIRRGHALGMWGSSIDGTGDATGGTVELRVQVNTDPYVYTADLVTIRWSDTTMSDVRIFAAQEDYLGVMLVTGFGTVDVDSYRYGLPRDVANWLRGIALVPRDSGATNLVRAHWGTNTDGEGYHLQIRGRIFDREAVFKGGGLQAEL